MKCINKACKNCDKDMYTKVDGFDRCLICGSEQLTIHIHIKEVKQIDFISLVITLDDGFGVNYVTEKTDEL